MDNAEVHTRFAAFLDWRGWSDNEAAAALGVSASYISHMRTGRRLAGRRSANAIERESLRWEHGPLKSTEWDEAEDLRRATKDAA